MGSLALGVAAFAPPALAYFPERYLVCEEGEERTGSVPTEAPPPEQEVVPVGRRRAPPRWTAAPLTVIDVPLVEPPPTRALLALGQESEPPLPVVREGRNDFRCIGATRGKPGILRAVSAPPGTRFLGHTRAASWIAVNMEAAGQFGFVEAIAALRRELERPFASPELDYHFFEELEPKLAAARALFDLGDRSSAPRLAALLQRIEVHPQIQWEAGVRLLARFDPEEAQRYALEVLDRLTSASGGPPADGSVDYDMVREIAAAGVIEALTLPSPDALARLRRYYDRRGGDAGVHSDPATHLTCQALAVRLRVGDEALRKELAPELATDLRTERGVDCYSLLIDLVFPGADPDEVDTLTFRHRYGGILRLAARMRDAARRGEHDAKLDAARDRLVRWLDAQSVAPDIAAGTSDTRYRWHEHGAHLVAQALLGNAAASAELERRVTRGGGDEAVAWDGTFYALRFGLAHAADLGAAMLEGAIDRAHGDRFDVSYHTNEGTPAGVVEELARRGDPRFALGLVHERFEPREAAVRALGRARPEGACRVVADGALRAQQRYDHQAVERAFWALSVLGEACRPVLDGLVSDASEPDDVRGMAVELLAMLRDPDIESLLPERGSDKHDQTPPAMAHRQEMRNWLRASLRRARIIFDAPE